MHDGRISDLCHVFRQYVESSVRAHRKHMASLHSTLKDVLEKNQTKSKSSSSSFSLQSASETELSLERGLNITQTLVHFIQIHSLSDVSHKDIPLQ